jgi:hypothetical protein
MLCRRSLLKVPESTVINCARVERRSLLVCITREKSELMRESAIAADPVPGTMLVAFTNTGLPSSFARVNRGDPAKLRFTDDGWLSLSE